MVRPCLDQKDCVVVHLSPESYLLTVCCSFSAGKMKPKKKITYEDSITEHNRALTKLNSNTYANWLYLGFKVSFGRSSSARFPAKLCRSKVIIWTCMGEVTLYGRILLSILNLRRILQMVNLAERNFGHQKNAHPEYGRVHRLRRVESQKDKSSE